MFSRSCKWPEVQESDLWSKVNWNGGPGPAVSALRPWEIPVLSDLKFLIYMMSGDNSTFSSTVMRSPETML
jgi:hypothetical protein